MPLFVKKIKYKNLDRSVLMAIYASRKAIKNANWKDGDFGINIGNLGGMNLPSTTVSDLLFNGRSPGVLGQEVRARDSDDTITITKIRNNSCK